MTTAASNGAQVSPPASDLSAEAAVLSAILLDPERLDGVHAIVQPRHFFSRDNREIFGAMVALGERRETVDVVTVRSELANRGRLDQVGGAAYLAQISDATPVIANVAEHAAIVVEKWRAREAASVGALLAAGAIDTATARARLKQIESDQRAPPPKSLELSPLGELIGPALERSERRRGGLDVPVPVPWPAYAEALGGGYWPGAHFIVAGTAVGKSQLTIQTALGAAQAGIPVIYVGLELDEAQIALRVLGEHAGLRWSGLYLGRCSVNDLARARESASALEGLPFYADFGSPRGWPVARLYDLIRAARAKHPTGPLLVVLDYLQLVGGDAGDFQRRPELRELIGAAAYAARDVARRFDASVVVVSSAARSHYGLLASDVREAGLCTRKVSGLFEPIRTIAHPHVLVGLGKESGEVEYSADTVTTLIRWPTLLDNGDRAIVCAVPKVRCGIERWSVLAFNGRFTELPVKSIDELPDVTKRGGAGKVVSEDELENRVLEALRRNSSLKTRTAIQESTIGGKAVVLEVINRLAEAGRIAEGEHGWFEVKGKNP